FKFNILPLSSNNLTANLLGAAANNAALEPLGPGGMLGGIAFLGVIGLVSEALTKYGFASVLSGVYLERLQKGDDAQQLIEEIRNLWISEDLKRELIAAIETESN
ncbi:MAG: hypothetical protein ACO34J_15320, partial [Prochlorothrix sp.]